MSLSSLLLGSPAGTSGQPSIDKGLDALFRATPSKTSTLSSAAKPGEKKRKLREDSESRTSKPVKSPADKKQKKVRLSLEETVPKEKNVLLGKDLKREKSKKKVDGGKRNMGKKKEIDSEVETDGKDMADAEDRGTPIVEDNQVAKRSSYDPQSDEDGPSTLVHESLKSRPAKSKSHSGARTKYIPAGETQQQRDARTIFVGNLPVEVAQKRTALKQLRRHILELVPSAKIESTRFRSVAFQTPTSKLPTSDDDDDRSPKNPKTNPDSTQAKQSRQHDRERASKWRDHNNKDDDDGKSDEKKLLTDKEKKKIAFINQDFHSSADSVNAYVVFAHPQPAETRPSNVPPPPPTMDPYDAARMASQECDGTEFMARVIRVDLVRNDDHMIEKSGGISKDADPKLNVFVGNLDFASKEDELRVFFEAAISAERGPPGGKDDREEHPKSWVTRVRIVRDKETQLGKGFAYVQFSDRECVDEVLALDDAKRKFAKRTLRVQRCKTLGGGSSAPKPPLSEPRKASSSSSRPISSKSATVPVVPKGDPSLGQKLAHLPKDVRKQYKSANADRVARRLAKKKARMALAVKGVKPQVKSRERVRKTSVKKRSVPSKETRGKSRSDKGVSKRNGKK